MLLVLDTNVVVSSLLWEGGPPARLIEAAENREASLATSRVLLAELARILARRKFAKAVAASTLTVEDLVLGYAALARIVDPAPIPPTSRDPDDDHVLAAALAAEADVVVSGDPDLLLLGRFRNIPIVTPREALEQLAA